MDTIQQQIWNLSHRIFQTFNAMLIIITIRIPQKHFYHNIRINIYNLEQMYYVNQDYLKDYVSKKTMAPVVISILTIPSEDRRLQDHQYVFKYFHDNKILTEIQRTKSLNAKQKCIALLQVDTKKPDPSQKSMLIIDKITVQVDKQQTKKYYVTLDEDKKNTIINSDQKYLRKNIQVLKNYMILKDMKYSQMLHLAYYMERANFKYKQQVYKEGDHSSYLYLVETGQFHFSKNVINQSQAHQKYKKKDRPVRYDAKSNNPNRTKNSEQYKDKVDSALVNSKLSLKESVNILQNIIKIPAQKYRKVIKDSYTKMQWLKKQNEKKIKFKDQVFNKILSVKNNYKKYAQLISKAQFNKTQDLRLKNNEQVTQNNEPDNNINSSNIYNRSKLPKIRSHSLVSDDHSLKNQNLDKSRITQPYIEEQRKSKIFKKSQISQQNEDEGTFALTKADYVKKKKNQKRERQNLSLHSPVTINTSNASLLPTLTSEQYKPSIHQTIDSNMGKNWSASRPIIQLKGLRKKFSGMIDSNSLIRQKQQIFNYKNKIVREHRQDIFPIKIPEKKQTHRQSIINLSKQQTRQMRSAVHSKSFMQKLLVQALKKAGYNSQKTSQAYLQQNSASVIDIKNNLKMPKQKAKLQKLSATNLLQKNQFDECYFKKFD